MAMSVETARGSIWRGKGPASSSSSMPPLASLAKQQLSHSVVDNWLTQHADAAANGGSDSNLLPGSSPKGWATSPLAPVLLPPAPSSGSQLRDLKDLRRQGTSLAGSSTSPSDLRRSNTSPSRPGTSPSRPGTSPSDPRRSCSGPPERPCSQQTVESRERPGTGSWMDLWSELSPTSPGRSRPASRGGCAAEVERQHIGLSDATRRENAKKEQYELQLEQANGGGADKKRGGTLDPLSTGADVAEALGLIKPEEFLLETANLDHKIEDMSRSVRLDHLADTKTEDKARQQREEARKQKEAELRRARKREQEARNPQRKVALRLENKRRFETEDSKDDKCIPMVKVEVATPKARSTVSLVDVRMLRARCKMLDEGNNVREMLDRDKRKEREDRLAQERSAAMERGLWPSRSSPELGAGEEGGYDQRLERAKARCQAHQVDSIIRKLTHCRNKLPYKLPYRFDVKKGERTENGDRPASPKLTIAPPTCGHSGREAEVAGALASKFACVPHHGSSLHGHNSCEVQKLMGELGRVVVVQEEAKKSTNRRKSSVERSRLDQIRAMAARTKMRRRWAAAKALVKVLLLYAHIVRRQGAIELVKSLLRQLGEWARVRRSIKRLMTSIKVLQMTCRQYQEYKRRRCELLQREWLRIEDQHLSAYFRICSQKAVKDMKAQAGQTPGTERRTSFSSPNARTLRNASKAQNASTQVATKKGEFLQMMETGVETGNLQMDWRSYRIPPKERWAIINCFYLNRLKRHVRSKGNFLAAVKARVETEREMVHFLKTFGADDTAVRDFQRSVVPSQEVTPPAFWHLSEDMALRLIALAAQSMVNEKPFQDHPANKGVPSDTYRSRPSPAEDPEAERSGRAASERAAALLRRLERPDWTVSLGRLRWRPQKKDQRPAPEPVVQEAARTGARMNIEDVFNRFTPRLREIADGQAVKSRMSIKPKDGIRGGEDDAEVVGGAG